MVHSGRSIYRSRKNNSGSLLILTVIFMFMLASMAVLFLFSVNTSMKSADSIINSTKAIYFAEAGLNMAMNYLLGTAPNGTTNGTWRTTAYPAPSGPSPTDPRQESFSEGSYTLWVQTAGSSVLITASGTCNGITRTVRHTVTLVATTPRSLSVNAATWGEG